MLPFLFEKHFFNKQTKTERPINKNVNVLKHYRLVSKTCVKAFIL